MELEILVPQVAAGLVDRLERDAVRVGQAGRFHKGGVLFVGARTAGRHGRDDHEVVGVVVLEVAGVKDILTKSLGSPNRINVAKATMLALSQLKDPKEELARRKGTNKDKGEEEAEVTDG